MRRAALGLVVLLVLAGCSGGDAPETPTVTPAPVPTDSATPEPRGVSLDATATPTPQVPVEELDPEGDPDGDGLTTEEELDRGLNPRRVDTDKDRLRDGEELAGVTDEGTPIPDADPARMDLYVRVTYGPRAEPYTPIVRERIVADWAAMPVRNPDGTTGISLHIVGTHNTSLRFFDGSDLEETAAALDEELPRNDAYHDVYLLPFVDVARHAHDGFAATPGRIALVDSTADSGNREVFFTHGLLHNVLGPLRGEGECQGVHYCEGGFLHPAPSTGSGVAFDDDRYLPEPLARVIERRGFRG
ncbi:hypothetical protein [Natronomonas sp. EA1]|uniref:hypothetical protein n=1 Tax=Natronomonas sp. EA1 TaxID=3421655 RepID=UPI003EBF11E8